MTTLKESIAIELLSTSRVYNFLIAEESEVTNLRTGIGTLFNNDNDITVAHIPSLKELESLLFVGLWSKKSQFPDYYFKQALNVFFKGKSYAQLVYSAIDLLSQRLHFRNQAILVKTDGWRHWQDNVLQISPLLQIAASCLRKKESGAPFEPDKLLLHNTRHTCIPSVFNVDLKHLFAGTGLADLHIHLNGSTEPDLLWHLILNKPQDFLDELKPSQGNLSVIEQYWQLGNLTPTQIFRYIHHAVKLKQNLVEHIAFTAYLRKLGISSSDSQYRPWQLEGLFFLRSLQELADSNSDQLALKLHQYLLLYHFFQKLVVQQRQQNGFDQFQKITVNELRSLGESSQSSYTKRYQQLQGMYGQPLKHLEGRFAPKTNLPASQRFLHTITGAHETYLQDNKDFTLSLVAHFVKLPDLRPIDKIMTFRDLPLRIRNQRALEALLAAKNADNRTHINFDSGNPFDSYWGDKKHKLPSNYIRGFDAAANEMHASPEAFAPTFRKLRRLGYENFTFHAGEDFVHLLSGIRTVYEAVHFLDMSEGNRIGHATALGIEPRLWQERYANNEVFIKRGEWLDNLIFSYQLLRKFTFPHEFISHLCDEIQKLAYEVYQTECVTLEPLVDAWLSRKFDPLYTLGLKEPSPLNKFGQAEVVSANSLDPRAMLLLRKYHSAESIAKHNEIIEIAPLQLIDIEKLVLLQTEMVKILNTKNIAIECLPSSNVSISFYDSYDEHHILRWLGLHRHSEPKPQVVLGSDDTGIFMTNIQNEYSYVYLLVKEHGDAKQAQDAIERLKQNAVKFAF